MRRLNDTRQHNKGKHEMTHEEAVAKTILAQLGGARFLLCTGSKNLRCGKNADGNPFLRFSLCNLKEYLPNATVRPNLCTITLNEAMDWYEMKFEYFREAATRFDSKTFTCKTTEEKRVATYECNEVYCDQLQEIFEQQTGLILDFCRVRFG